MERRLDLKLKTSLSPIQTSLDKMYRRLTRELADQIERFEADWRHGCCVPTPQKSFHGIVAYL